MKVCVVGGGPAGVGAALEASWRGAKVVLFEVGHSLPPPMEEWPGALRPNPLKWEDPLPGLEAEGVEVRFGVGVAAVTDRHTSVASSGPVPFDRTIVCTGTASAGQAVRGSSLDGVWLLDRFSAYGELAEHVPSFSRAVVGGPLLTSLRVADSLAGPGREVAVFAEGGIGGLVGPENVRVLEEAAERRGVRVIDGSVDKVVGVGKVEAVMAAGRVYPCDLVALIPPFRVSLPDISVRKDSSGRLALDRFMRTSAADIYGAGSCSAVTGCQAAGAAKPPAPSGRIAAVNACGQETEFTPIELKFVTAFGLSIVAAGQGLERASSEGLDCSVVVRRTPRGSACSIVYERLTGRTLGVQLISGEGEAETALVKVAVSQGVRLKTLAYQQGLGSTDKSLLSETARMGLREAASRW